MVRKDPLKILEAAYSFDIDETAWIRGIVEAARPYDLGEGVFGHIADMKTSSIRVYEGHSNVMDVSALPQIAAAMPPRAFKYFYAPRPTAFSFDVIREGPAAAGVEASLVEEIEQRTVPCPPMFLVVGGDPEVETAFLGLTCREVSDLRGATREVLDGVAAHLGAALRLRSVLLGAPNPAHEASEAVLSPDGKVLDANGPAQRGRASLIEAIKRFDRARTRKATPEERLELWTALIEGRWSIVETIERDGKRLLLACKNEPRTAPMRRLSSRERSVVQYAALGHPLKYIGYELGISLPAVSNNLRSAMSKLGLESRVELIRTFGV